MKFVYIGDPEAPRTTTVYGYTFKIEGDAVEIKEESIIKKLQGMAGFVLEKDYKAQNKSRNQNNNKQEHYNSLVKFVKDNNIKVENKKLATLENAVEEFKKASSGEEDDPDII